MKAKLNLKKKISYKGINNVNVIFFFLAASVNTYFNVKASDADA